MVQHGLCLVERPGCHSRWLLVTLSVGLGSRGPEPRSGDTEQNRLSLRAVHVWRCWDPDGTPEAARAES